MIVMDRNVVYRWSCLHVQIQFAAYPQHSVNHLAIDG